jgi:hypothetical protein
MTRYHKELLRSLMHERLTEEEGLLWIVLLHTHAIHAHMEALTADASATGTRGATVLPADTQRGVAHIIASLWPDRTDHQRCDYAYWYWQYNTKTPYEVLSDMPQDQLARLLELRDTLAKDPRVIAVVEE